MGDALLKATLESVSRYGDTEAEPWHTGVLTSKERAILHRECTSPSEFDELRSRASFYERFRSGDIEPVIRQTAHGKVIALLEHPSQEQEIPWALWSRILQGFASFTGPSFYTVFLCAHPALRTFPEHSHSPIRPFHINGGYTYPCDKSCVFIYRAEDATRVLLHELLHAACTDRKGVHLEQMEAETEAWAELLWCAFLSRGDLKKMKALVATQSRWMAAQNERLVRHGHMGPGPQMFPWRYTLGKTQMWMRWGIYRPGDISGATLPMSLRLTTPPTAAQKRAFGVSASSVFL